MRKPLVVVLVSGRSQHWILDRGATANCWPGALRELECSDIVRRIIFGKVVDTAVCQYLYCIWKYGLNTVPTEPYVYPYVRSQSMA